MAHGSLALVPFTAQYARESTPREYWDSPLFRKANRVLTLLWGSVFAVRAVLGLIAVHVPSGNDWLNWVIPVVLLVMAVGVTRSCPDRLKERESAARRRT